MFLFCLNDCVSLREVKTKARAPFFITTKVEVWTSSKNLIQPTNQWNFMLLFLGVVLFLSTFDTYMKCILCIIIYVIIITIIVIVIIVFTLAWTDDILSVESNIRDIKIQLLFCHSHTTFKIQFKFHSIILFFVYVYFIFILTFSFVSKLAAADQSDGPSMLNFASGQFERVIQFQFW